MDLVVQYRISRRIKEQFGAFMEGLLDLIPKDLITVFDERELELLIGGMSEIDMYVFDRAVFSDPDFFFLYLPCINTGMIGPSLQITEVMKRLIKLSNGSGNAFGLGQRRGKRDYCNLRLGLLGCLLMGLKTFKVRMDRGGLRLRNPEILVGCREVIRALIGWIYRRIRIMRVWRVNCCLRLSMCFFILWFLWCGN